MRSAAAREPCEYVGQPVGGGLSSSSKGISKRTDVAAGVDQIWQICQIRFCNVCKIVFGKSLLRFHQLLHHRFFVFTTTRARAPGSAAPEMCSYGKGVKQRETAPSKRGLPVRARARKIADFQTNVAKTFGAEQFGIPTGQKAR